MGAEVSAPLADGCEGDEHRVAAGCGSGPPQGRAAPSKGLSVRPVWEEAPGHGWPCGCASCGRGGPPSADRGASPEPHRPPILQLSADLLLRIAWTSAAGAAHVADCCALSVACGELWSAVQDARCPLWGRKLDAILALGRCDPRAPWPRRAHLGPRPLCIRLLAAGRLLRSSLTCCDWLALYDANEVLHAAGAADPRLLLVVIRGMLAMQAQPPTLQALQWLWDLASGIARPWSGVARPTPATVQLDRLRQWLHCHVSRTIVPWHQLQAFRLDDSYDGLFPEIAQRVLSEQVSRIATFLLLAAECAAPPSGSELGRVASVAELAAAVEGTLASESGSHEQVWALVLLLFARLLRALPAHVGRPERGCGWRGVAVTWPTCSSRLQAAAQVSRDGLPPPPPLLAAGGGVEELSFPGLVVDRRWLHTQHGTVSALGSDRPPAAAQLDARFDARSSCFVGPWLDHGSARQLTAKVFVLNAWSGGLRHWLDETSGELSESRFSQLDVADAAEVSELFGVAGGPSSASVRCFHLARAPSW